MKKYSISPDLKEFSKRFVNRKDELSRLDSVLGGNKRYAFVYGEGGLGKTVLLLAFSIFSHKKFPGGIFHINRLMSEYPNQGALLIVDDIELLSSASKSDIYSVFKQTPNLKLLAAGREYTDIFGIPDLIINLSGLDRRSFHDLFKQRISKLDDDVVNKLFHKSQGNPRLALEAAESIRNGIVNWKQLEKGYNDFDYSPIVGPDGKPLSSKKPLKQIIIEVSEVNEELLSRLKSEPFLMRNLDSRKFEELVATLLNNMDYEIELTPQSKDGGFDMYAAKKDGLGRFLYLVECKRFTPPNKVGVQIVRALHGVVQQSRANAGIIVTTSFFTSGAQEFQKEIEYQLQLKDYFAIQNWLGIS